MACADLPAYTDAIAAHRRTVVAACVGAASVRCEHGKQALEYFIAQREACLADKDVGPPQLPPGIPEEPAPPPPRPSKLVGYAELGAGGGIAIANKSWRGAVDPSGSLALRGGAAYGAIGGMVSLEWTSVRVGGRTTIFRPEDWNPTMGRLRALAHVFYDFHVLPELAIGARAGAGIEQMSADYDVLQPSGLTAHMSSDHVGFAFEVGAAGWYRLTKMIEAGGTLDVPASLHAPAYGIVFPDASYSLELVLGLRFNTR